MNFAKNQLKIAPKVIIFKIYPNPMEQYQPNMVQRWITTRLMTFLVKFLKGQGSKVNELCQNWLKIAPKQIFFTLNPILMIQFKPNIVQRCITSWRQTGEVWVKFLKGQRSMNFTQNWLILNKLDTRMDLDRLVRLEVKEVRGQKSMNIAKLG